MNKWQKIDETNNLVFPYYVDELLHDFKNWDMKDWKVFEYGGGNSTTWWRDKCRECVTIDTCSNWSKKKGLLHVSDKNEFINYPKKIVQQSGEKFDCIIIDQGRDSRGQAFRDDCTEVAVECLKDNGVLIIDNWKQDTIPAYGKTKWPKSEKILSKYKGRVYRQKNHQDWKTAVWYIDKEVSGGN